MTNRQHHHPALGRRALALGAAALALPRPADAQPAPAGPNWPDHPIRWLVGYAPGGASDVMARLMGGALTQRLGQPVVIENRPSGGAVIAAEAAARAAPDGYTLLHVDNGIMVYNPALYARLPYDPARDFAPVGFIGRFPLAILVRPDHPAQSFAQLLEASKRTPVTYGTPGVASPHHLAMELVKQRTGLEATHVPYRGGPPAMNDLLGERVDTVVMDFSTGLPFVQAGRARPLAVFSDARSPAMPAAPTLTELGYPAAVAYGWQGVVAPAGTPAPIIARLNEELVRAVSQEGEVRARLLAIGVELVPQTPAAFTGQIAREATVWQPLIRQLGIRLDT